MGYDALAKQISVTRASIKRKRVELFGLDTEDAWEEYFHHLYRNLEEVCASNLFIKEFLQEKIKKIRSEEQKKKRTSLSKGIRKCRETLALVDDDSRVVFASRKTPLDDLRNKFGKIEVIDVSPAGHYNKLHPAWPITSVDLPGADKDSAAKASSVQGLYEGLRLFENEKKISLNVLLCDNMKIHRSQTKTTGEIIGYRFGLKETAEVIDELKARYYLFIKPYEEMLSRKEQKALLETLKEKLDSDPNLRLVLVDAKIPNPDWKNLEQDISHCPLIRDMLSKKWPKWEEPEKGDDEEEEDVEEEEEDDDEEMADNTEDGDEESEEEESDEVEESEESDE